MSQESHQQEIPELQGALTLGGHDPAYLSTFQQNQGQTNDCGAYSIAAAISLLRGGRRVDYAQIVTLANRRTTLHWGLLAGLYGLIFGRGLRLWPGGPMPPRQQANLARTVARRRGMKVTARASRGTPADLLAHLAQPDTAVLVTLAWDDDACPRIVYPDGSLQHFAPVAHQTVAGKSIRYPFAAHVMLLAAYDPSRAVQVDEETIATPWGFVNSWIDGGGELFWMPDPDFQTAWGYNIVIGSNWMVVITLADG